MNEAALSNNTPAQSRVNSNASTDQNEAVLMSKIANMEALLADKETHIDRLIIDISALNKSRNEFEEKFIQANNQNQALAESVVAKEARMEQLESSISQMNSEIYTLQQQSQQGQTREEQLESSISQANSEIYTLQQQLQQGERRRNN